ncbi:MAG: hypothetical protein K9L31_03205 [Candidatus Pacebacteria bacterium]|nr:hypothetical protein [Candidatus Paceibacterota bacterium]
MLENNTVDQDEINEVTNEDVDNTTEEVTNEVADSNESSDEASEEKSDGDGVDQKEKAKANTENTKVENDEDDEPKTFKRKTVKDFIIERQQKKIKKLDDRYNSDYLNDNDDDSSDDKDEDKEFITNVVAEKFKPLFEKQIAEEDDIEIKKFISENPDFKNYESKARKYISHPSRRNLPIESIFYEVAGKDLMKLGAERQRQADEEARQTQAGGGSNRGESTERNIWDLTPEEFEAQKNELRKKL